MRSILFIHNFYLHACLVIDMALLKTKDFTTLSHEVK